MLNARPVQGFFRQLRWAADGILIAILLVIPWLRIDGEPLVLLDVPGRKFHVFGLVIFPQELYFLWLIVAGLALALFFFTALAGRLWCGWACPQTVLTDVYAAVARRLQGWTRTGPPARIATWRKLATHGVWVLLSLVLGFHLVGYFVSPYELLPALRTGTLTPTEAGFLIAASGLAYLDFVGVRQTFCKFLCPYARFQSVLFDRDTLVIGYDRLRGEPRTRRLQRGAAATTAGDCVDCGLCVAVCPSEIDIRNGLQLECIACTQCIDACNGVMERLGRPRNLIGYRSLVGLERIRRVRLLRPRVVIYAALLAAVSLAFVSLLAERVPLGLEVAHNPSALSGASADGRVANAFTLQIQNRDRVARVLRLRIEAPQGFELLAGVNPLRVPPLATVEARVFVLADQEALEEELEHRSGRFRFVVEEISDPRRSVSATATFLAPLHGLVGKAARAGRGDS
jgi:cytochrome c oxidase accessory protein FixG